MDKTIEKLIELIKPYVSDLACEQESGSCEFTDCRSCNALYVAHKLIANGAEIPVMKEKANRKFTFEDEAKLYEKEACAEFAKETGNDDCSGVNNILRRGMRIICKARQELASRVEVVHGKWEEIGVADYKCSRCGFRFTSADPISMFQYCRCGAKMDGGE